MREFRSLSPGPIRPLFPLTVFPKPDRLPLKLSFQPSGMDLTECGTEAEITVAIQKRLQG
jgi:hypothetical protein